MRLASPSSACYPCDNTLGTTMTKRSLGLVMAFSAAVVQAANWGQWRGPNFDGSSPETGLPEKFSTNENVRWVAPMPGPSGSTPAIWENWVFTSTVDAAKKTRQALALERTTGKIVWQQDVGPG